MNPDTNACQCYDFDPREGHQPGCPLRCPLRDKCSHDDAEWEPKNVYQQDDPHDD